MSLLVNADTCPSSPVQHIRIPRQLNRSIATHSQNDIYHTPLDSPSLHTRCLVISLGKKITATRGENVNMGHNKLLSLETVMGVFLMRTDWASEGGRGVWTHPLLFELS